MSISLLLHMSISLLLHMLISPLAEPLRDLGQWRVGVYESLGFGTNGKTFVEERRAMPRFYAIEGNSGLDSIQGLFCFLHVYHAYVYVHI